MMHTTQHGHAHGIRGARRYSHDAVLRFGRTIGGFRTGLRRSVPGGFGLWVLARRMAVRRRGNRLVRRGAAPLVEKTVRSGQATSSGLELTHDPASRSFVAETPGALALGSDQHLPGVQEPLPGAAVRKAREPADDDRLHAPC